MKLYLLFLFIFICKLNELSAKTNSKNVVIEDINDIKQLKKLFRTKTNVLLLYISSAKEAQNTVKIFKDAAEIIKGQGTMVLLDCANSEVKKLCKKLKVSPTPALLKHYKDGDFHKDYDRQITVSSIVNFMRDPAGDLPWEEDPSGIDIIHINDAASLGKFLKKEQKPAMVMFYAPWCGYCKSLKPEYAAAASQIKDKFALAAIDVNRPENTIVRKQFNITGFPTLLYYENGNLKHTYEGDNKKDAIISFMENPAAPPATKPKESDWSTETTSEIVHLTATSFEPAIKDEKSVLVMFYAPWCGHCKRMKPEYEKAAEIMKSQKIAGVLAALDSTKEGAIATQYGVKGYPTVKYFANGEFKFDVNVRDSNKIIEFMKNPTEPPPPPPPEKAWEDEPSDVVHLTDETFKQFLKKKKHVLVMFYAPWCGHCKQAKPEFVEAADTFKDNPRIELAAVDCTKHATVCSANEVKGYPTIKYYSYYTTKRDYSMGRKAKDFINYLFNSDKSEKKEGNIGKVLTNNDFGVYPGVEHIIQLSDDSFDKTLQTESLVFVIFHAPWCTICDEIKPEFSLAAKHLAKENYTLKFAAINCDKNEETQEKLDIQAFPTIKLFRNGKYVEDYTGVREFKEFVTYAIEHAKSRKNVKNEL